MRKLKRTLKINKRKYGLIKENQKKYRTHKIQTKPKGLPKENNK